MRRPFTLLAACLFLLAACLVVVADEASGDDRIKISVSPAPKTEAPAATDPATSEDAAKPDEDPSEPEKSPAERLAAEERIKFDYDGVPFRDVLADLSERFKVLIICRDEKLLDRKFFRHIELPASAAIRMICGHLLQEPIPAYILCSKDELIENEKLPQVKAKDLLVSLDVTEAPLEETLQALGKAVEARMTATNSLYKKAVTCKVEGATLKDTLQALADKAEAVVTTGYVLEQVNIGAGLEQLEAMPTEDLEKAVRGFLDGSKKATTENPDLQKTITGNIQSGMMDGVRMFNDLEPEEQTWVVQKGAEAITRLGGVMRRLSPQTQTDLKQVIKPYLGLVLVGYMRMPSETRAKIGPLMNAINSLGW